MSPAVENAIAIAIAGGCAVYLLREAVRFARRLLGRGARGGTCGGGCGGGCADGVARKSPARRPVTLEKLPRG
jgi:hypothetical protein